VKESFEGRFGPIVGAISFLLLWQQQLCSGCLQNILFYQNHKNSGSECETNEVKNHAANFRVRREGRILDDSFTLL